MEEPTAWLPNAYGDPQNIFCLRPFWARNSCEDQSLEFHCAEFQDELLSCWASNKLHMHGSAAPSAGSRRQETKPCYSMMTFTMSFYVIFMSLWDELALNPLSTAANPTVWERIMKRTGIYIYIHTYIYIHIYIHILSNALHSHVQYPADHASSRQVRFCMMHWPKVGGLRSGTLEP